MGLGGVSIWQLLIILAIVVMVFGTKRLKNIGSDLGETIKGFRQSMNDGEQGAKPSVDDKGQTINSQAHKVEDPLKKD